MIKAVIDTNVIVSAYITKNLEAATSKVWEAVLQYKLIPVYNEEILNEYSEVLRREKFGIPRHLIESALEIIVANSIRGERVMSEEFFFRP
ncbi:MAG: putative toxin-antitoxin system toxin component, PIN family [Bacteroidaceae bacterium]|nr:putative toxin-antitoxin system toxin component, PIN family [Bacteroidaceae bacterium]